MDSPPSSISYFSILSLHGNPQNSVLHTWSVYDSLNSMSGPVSKSENIEIKTT